MLYFSTNGSQKLFLLSVFFISMINKNTLLDKLKNAVTGFGELDSVCIFAQSVDN